MVYLGFVYLGILYLGFYIEFLNIIFVSCKAETITIPIFNTVAYIFVYLGFM